MVLSSFVKERQERSRVMAQSPVRLPSGRANPKAYLCDSRRRNHGYPEGKGAVDAQPELALQASLDTRH